MQFGLNSMRGQLQIPQEKIAEGAQRLTCQKKWKNHPMKSLQNENKLRT